MKSQLMLLSLLLGCSSAIAAAPAEVPSSHNGKPKASQHSPKPPRLISPPEFEQQQQRLHAAHNQSRHEVHSINTLDTQLPRQFQRLQAANTGCGSAAELLPLSGTDLVTAIENANLTSCLYGLYNKDLLGSDHFSDSKISTVVNAIVQRLPYFNGSDSSGAAALEKLVTYLRAMHWVEAGSNRQFSASYRNSLLQAFDQYFAGAHFVRFDGDVSRNFMLRYEMLILVNSSGTDALRYLPRFSQALKGYASTVSRAEGWGVGYEENGLTQVLTHYFNATNSGSAAMAQLLENEPQIINNLRDFVMNDGLWLVGHQREYQWSDAITELGRLLKFGGAIADQVRPALQSILSTYQFGGTGSNGWVNAQGMVKFYDSGNCQLYGNACEFDLEGTVLSGRHSCGDTLKLRFQQPISDTNLQQICSNLALQEQDFHRVFANPNPVANDNNTALEMVIFSSAADYQNYAGTFFNIDTNNGGMYLEGTPSDPDNQARFIAYQATWLQPDFVVWNLEHEYVHYLDGRFNQWGGFNDQPLNSVWWGEGLAEYLSKGTNNANALAVAADKTFQLSDLFQTTYENSNTERTYYWGYLATRFMFEYKRQLIDNELLPSLRAAKYLISDAPCSFDWGWQSKADAIANNWVWLYDDSEWSAGNWVWTCGQPEQPDASPLPDYTPYADIIANWGTGFDSAFHNWLDCILTDDDCSDNTPALPVLQNGVAVSVNGNKGSEQHFAINLPENAYDLNITTAGGSGDVDLYVREALTASLTEWDYRPYVIGNREKVNILQPLSSNWFVMLHGYRDYSDAKLTASWKLGTLTELQRWPALSSNYALYKWVYVPAEAKALYVTLDNGSGDAQLYVKRDGWPTPGSYDGASSTTRGTKQKVQLTNIVPGSYYHIMVNTLEGFTDVTMQVSMVE